MLLNARPRHPGRENPRQASCRGLWRPPCGPRPHVNAYARQP
ncbi:hypothetical protein BN940_14836 [Castellaniella defragrans 65Phen]|uniref:Uncharacterized protein n=1 Tax=Castellaniella defragrans (strain DSM 12143 / CCUG 39792 / 65Phen) TaxID=1437824 RepID=W8X589_CASD6|nr:hypothetical protein BN940_14836 [Castellaniella defragrans 65Phen]